MPFWIIYNVSRLLHDKDMVNLDNKDDNRVGLEWLYLCQPFSVYLK